jgi:serine-aspartate repeat-containing protein C/D/E
MYIDLNNAGVFQAGDPEVTTDALGNFTFTGLTAGTYIVRQIIPKGFIQTSPTNNFGNHIVVIPNQGPDFADFADEV